MTCLAEMETFVEARETTGLAQAKTSQAKGAKMIRWTDDAPTEIRAEEGWTLSRAATNFPRRRRLITQHRRLVRHDIRN